MNLLIHADPGARSGFLAAWLTGKLTELQFDAGRAIKPKFTKIHYLDNTDQLLKFNGTKIRIRPTFNKLDLHILLFLRKNVYEQIPDFTRDEYSLDTFTKLAVFAEEIFDWNSQLNYDYYTHVINFEDTFDIKRMIDLYIELNNTSPSQIEIDMLHRTTELNSIVIDRNHASSIVKLTMEKEAQLALNQQHRFWSIVDLYNTVPISDLYNAVDRAITPDNYGIYLGPLQ